MNAFEVLNNLYDLQKQYPSGHCPIGYNCDKVGIFDWWKDYLSKKDIQDMIKFVEKAMSWGFQGHVCFKVGVRGCANGMWAYEHPTREDGYSPNTGMCLYRSFTPAYARWDARDKSGIWMHEMYKEEAYEKLSQLTKLMKERNMI